MPPSVLMISVCKLPINKIKGYLFSILSLSGPSSGSPSRLIKSRSSNKNAAFIHMIGRMVVGFATAYAISANHH
jgi:hypothetical protein